MPLPWGTHPTVWDPVTSAGKVLSWVLPRPQPVLIVLATGRVPSGQGP